MYIEKNYNGRTPKKLPRYIYKYYGNLEYVIDVIKNKHIHLEIPSDYNDVFDSARIINNAEFDFVRYDNQIESIIVNTKYEYIDLVASLLQKCEYDLVYLEDVFKYLVQNNVPLSVVEEIKSLLCKHLKNTQPQNNKIACFAEKKNSLLMWAHYGNHLNGACLCFDTKKDIELFSHIHNVDYTKFRNNDRNYNFYYSKASEWKYEKEWRIVAQTKENYIETESCVGIILGERTLLNNNLNRNALSNFSYISFLANEQGLNVYKAVSNSLKYRIDVEKRI